jgi:hypothetical protein
VLDPRVLLRVAGALHDQRVTVLGETLDDLTASDLRGEDADLQVATQTFAAMLAATPMGT